MDCTHGRQESLADFLARLRPGDSCACCGATLRSLDREGLDEGRGACHTSSTVSGLRAKSAVIVCPECGCEISEESGPDAEAARRELSTAA